MSFFMTQAFENAGVPQGAMAELSANLRARALDTGEFLIRQGEPAPDLFMIRKGLAKMFYVTPDGKEFVKSFLAEGAFIGSLIAQMEKPESSFSVVCLEPVEVEAVAYNYVQDLFETDPMAMKFGFRFFQALALKKEKREYSFLCLSAEDRYCAFLEENANLAGRLTQADIARYLGITPVALSRIRGRLKSS